MAEMSSLHVFFRSTSIFVFFGPEGGGGRTMSPMHIDRKFDKDHLLSFSAQRKNTIFSGKNKYHLSRYYKKDRVLARISWKDYLSRTPEENITFPGIFRGKIIFSFVSKL